MKDVILSDPELICVATSMIEVVHCDPASYSVLYQVSTVRESEIASLCVLSNIWLAMFSVSIVVKEMIEHHFKCYFFR